MLLASRAEGWLLLTSILILTIPSMGLKRPAVKHIWQHVDALVGAPFSTVDEGSHPVAAWRAPARGPSDPHQPNKASQWPYGVQHPSVEPRQVPNTRRQVPTDSRPGPEKGNKYAQQPSLQARHFSNSRQHAPNDDRPTRPRPYKGDRPEQPNHQPQYQFHQPPSSAQERRGRLRVDTEDRHVGVNTRKPYMPQHRLEPERYQLRGSYGKVQDTRAKWQVSRHGCRLLMLPQLAQTIHNVTYPSLSSCCAYTHRLNPMASLLHC